MALKRQIFVYSSNHNNFIIVALIHMDYLAVVSALISTSMTQPYVIRACALTHANTGQIVKTWSLIHHTFTRKCVITLTPTIILPTVQGSKSQAKLSKDTAQARATMLRQHKREVAREPKRMRRDEPCSPSSETGDGSSVRNMACSHTSSHFYFPTDKNTQTTIGLALTHMPSRLCKTFLARRRLARIRAAVTFNIANGVSCMII